jgi:hypothetical protein
LDSLHVQRVFLAGVCLREVRHVGIHDAGSHGVDPNSARAKRGGEVFHQRVDRSLRRRISGQRANYRMCAERRNEHNTAAIAKNGKRLLNQKERRANIDSEKAVEILNSRVLNVRRLCYACVRDEDIQPVANDTANLPRQVVWPGQSSEIRRQGLGPAAAVANLSDDGFGFATAIVNQNLRGLCREKLR